MNNTNILGKTIFVIGQSKYYISFEKDLKDRIIYTDDFGSHFYKDKSKVIYFSNQQEEEFRELRKKYN